MFVCKMSHVFHSKQHSYRKNSQFIQKNKRKNKKERANKIQKRRQQKDIKCFVPNYQFPIESEPNYS